MAAVVILPDQLHCVWTLVPGDLNFSTRWGFIKGRFSRPVAEGEGGLKSGITRERGRGFWQRRFWEHWARDGDYFIRHVD